MPYVTVKLWFMPSYTLYAHLHSLSTLWSIFVAFKTAIISQDIDKEGSGNIPLRVCVPLHPKVFPLDLVSLSTIMSL